MPLPQSPRANLADVAKRLLPNKGNEIAQNIGQWSGQALAPRQTFFDFLQKWETSIPLQSLWMVIFNIPPTVKLADGRNASFDTMMKLYGEYVLSGKDSNWSSDKTRKKFLKYFTADNTSVGCAFAIGANIPGETCEINQVGFNNRGFLKDPIMEYRAPLQALTLNLIETNVSFIDHLIRPWVVLSSHRGFAARRESAGDPLGGRWGGLATDITLVHFAKVGTDFNFKGADKADINSKGLMPRKVWVFKDCVPIKVDNQDVKYGIDNDLQTRAIEWQYRRYQVYWPDDVLKSLDDNNDKDEAEAIKNNNVARGFTKASQTEIEKAHLDGERDPGKDDPNSFLAGQTFLSESGREANTTTDLRKKYKNYDKEEKVSKYDYQKMPGDSHSKPIDLATGTFLRPRPHISQNIYKGTTITKLQKIYEDVQGTKREDATGEDAFETSKDYQNAGPFSKDGASPQTILDNYTATYEEQYYSGEMVWDAGAGGAAGVQKTLMNTEKLGHGGATADDSFPPIQDGQYTNMGNLKAPKKIKQGSGIFGLLGL